LMWRSSSVHSLASKHCESVFDFEI